MPSQAAEEGPCRLCGADDYRRLVTKLGYDVVRCRGCGLVFVWPQPAPEDLEALYSSGAYHGQIDQAERRRYAERRLDEIERLVPPSGRLLDVGCSRGYLLEAARDRGWQAAGVELNPRSVELARSRGLEVHCGQLADAPLAPESFDVVTAFDVIEHLRSPRAFLAQVHRLLRPDGLLVLTTPNIGGLVPRCTYWLVGRTVGAWEHPTPPGHLVQFSRHTLFAILSRTGFRVAVWRAEHIPVAYSVGKLENSVMDVLAGRHKQRPNIRGPRDFCRDSGNARPVRRPRTSLPRLTVRAVAWVLLGTLWSLARLTGLGDSQWAAARKTLTGGETQPIGAKSDTGACPS